MADEIKKTTDEVKENTAVTQEGAIPDDEAEAVAGGKTEWYPRKGVHADPTLTNTRR